MTQPPPTPPPLQTIPYATARTEHRPGLMTALGIVSIIIACLSGLVSCGHIVSSASMLAMSKLRNTPPVARAASRPATMPSTTTSSSVAFSAFSFNVPPAASILWIVVASLSLGVAVLLLVAGILTLRDSIRAYRFHWIYILLKIPLVILGGAAAWMTASAMMQSVYSSMGSSAPSPMLRTWMAAVQVIVSVGISLAYPAALIITLSLPGTRSYYASLRKPR